MLTVAQNDRRLSGAALDAMSEKVLILDRKGRLILANQAWRDFYQEQGWHDPVFGLGRTLRSLRIVRNNRVRAAEVFCGLDRVVAGTDAEFTCTFRIRDRQAKWLRVHAAHIDHGERAGAVVTLEDVSDVHSARQAVNDMSLRLACVRQEERRRIALDLHDSTAQHLAAAKLNLTGLRNRVALSAPDARLLDDIDLSLQTALHEVQVTTFLLYPPELDKDGLNATLERFVRTYARQTGISTQLRTPHLERLTRELQRSILRIVQEALANVHRHAQSPQAHVRLRLTRESVVLYVADVGKGMSWTGLPNESEVSTGLGIAGMRARAAQLGGELRVKSRRGEGTRILARIPHSRNASTLPSPRQSIPSWKSAGADAKARRVKSVSMAKAS